MVINNIYDKLEKEVVKELKNTAWGQGSIASKDGEFDKASFSRNFDK